MTVSAGSRLGHYEILAPIGAGGMGEVYRAMDARLDRIVAVKVLPPHLSSSRESRQRFEREAKTISQLSHPHICALYDVGRQGDIDYLVMEYLEGETLAHRLAYRRLAIGEVLRLGAEIAGALDLAHRQGIVHRDLKPSNVMLTKSGAKLLDFGLAKPVALDPEAGLSTQTDLTQQGRILGTLQYMSPEQLEGRTVDARSDIFALGCVLHEMATGKKAFPGDSTASVISAIMTSQPDAITAAQPAAPAALDRVVRVCLAKDPNERWQSARDLGRELEWIAQGGSGSGVVAPASVEQVRTPAWLRWTGAALLVAAAFAAGRALRSASPVDIVRASIELPPQMNLESLNTAFALSPDGTTLAMAATGSDGKQLLYVRRMDGYAIQALPGTEEATIPFWSPDSRWIGFFADRKLKKVPASGGVVQTICDARDGRGASWSVSGEIVFAPGPFGGLFRVPASGGTPAALTRTSGPGETHRLPWFLPDGERLFYLAATPTSDLERESSIRVLEMSTGRSTLVAKENSEGRFAAPGHLLFVRDGDLMAQPFDVSNQRTTGAAVPVADEVLFHPLRWCGNFSVSGNGRLVVQNAAGIRKSRLTWFDPDGKELGRVSDAAGFSSVAVSPDGRRAAVTIEGSGSARPEIWIQDLAHGVGSRFTHGETGHVYPVWSPDGRRLAYGGVGAGIIVKSVDASSEGRIVWPIRTNAWPLSWFSDGQLLVRVHDPATDAVDLWLLPLEPDAKPRKLLASDGSARFGGSISPDGKWLLYASNESGRRELYLVPFPELGEKRQVSPAGITRADWLGPGRIFYTQPPDERPFAVDLHSAADSVVIDPPRPIFGGRPAPSVFGVAPDGQRLLVAVPVNEGHSAQIRFVSDWRAEWPR